MSSYEKEPSKNNLSTKSDRKIERLEPEEIFGSVEEVSLNPTSSIHYKRHLSIETYQELLTISSLRTRLFVASAILATVWFIWQALSPAIRSMFTERYSAINESFTILVFGLISIGVSVGIGTLFIQFRVQNRHLINPISEAETDSK